MKRFAAPTVYPLHRKQGTYAVTPRGPHPAERSVPLGILLRDMLNTADTLDEAEEILNNGHVVVDGVRRRNPHYTVGFMDVVTLPPVDTAYRFIITEDGAELRDADDPETKICKVTGKKTLPGGDTQLNLHDGKNIVTDADTDCSPGDSVKITLPDQSIDEHLPFEEGSQVYITAGQHRGHTAEVKSIREVRGSDPNLITLEDANGNEFEITPESLYVIGEVEL